MIKQQHHNTATCSNFPSYATIALIALVALFAPITMYTNSSFEAYAQTPMESVLGGGINAITDKGTYFYGEKILITIEDFNTQQKKTITESKTDYPGVQGPCGIDYFDVVFLTGDHSNITNYDELIQVKNNALNVLWSEPYNAYSCPFGDFVGTDKVIQDSNSRNAVITYHNKEGESITLERNLISVYEIQNVYGQQSIREKISDTEEREYVSSERITPGTYTVFAFNQAGQISSPVLIKVIPEIVSTDNQTNPDVQDTMSFSFLDGNMGLLASLAIPTVFGTFMGLRLKRNPKMNNNLKAFLLVILVCFGTIPLTVSNSAYGAAYNVSTQGVEHRSTGTSFKQATVEDRFEGVVTDIGTNNGLSTQNNHFVNNFVVGNNWLWSQSPVQLERNTATLNNHSCTTQAGAYTCKLPSEVKVRGVPQIWTTTNIFGQCPPSPFTSVGGGLCVNIQTGSWNTVTLSSSVTRLDLNTYQEIQSSGTMYLDQKYRTCTGSFSCTGYTNIKSYTTPTAYASSTNGHYNSQSISGTTYYGNGATVGECAASVGCNLNTGRVNFYDGSYYTKAYVINSSGSPAYRATSVNSFPTEENKNICWWDSISNSGGSNPTFTTTARYNSACQS